MVELVIDQELQALIRRGLAEDLGERGDLTSRAVVRAGAMAEARIIAKGAGLVAGQTVAQAVFGEIDRQVVYEAQKLDGATVTPGDLIARLAGPAAPILHAERTALNFLQHLSGVASLTARFVREAGAVQVFDTRKTLPGLRRLEKYAVTVGGGHNHRAALDDGLLLKENHLALAGSIGEAVRRLKRTASNLKVEVEVETLTQVKEALAAGIDILLLDNMSLPQIEAAVGLAKGKVEIEVSGGVTLETVGQLAKLGVDRISVGALTAAAPPLDMSLLIDPA